MAEDQNNAESITATLRTAARLVVRRTGDDLSQIVEILESALDLVRSDPERYVDDSLDGEALCCLHSIIFNEDLSGTSVHQYASIILIDLYVRALALKTSENKGGPINTRDASEPTISNPFIDTFSLAIRMDHGQAEGKYTVRVPRGGSHVEVTVVSIPVETLYSNQSQLIKKYAIEVIPIVNNIQFFMLIGLLEEDDSDIKSTTISKILGYLDTLGILVIPPTIDESSEISLNSESTKNKPERKEQEQDTKGRIVKRRRSKYRTHESNEMNIRNVEEATKLFLARVAFIKICDLIEDKDIEIRKIAVGSLSQFAIDYLVKVLLQALLKTPLKFDHDNQLVKSEQRAYHFYLESSNVGSFLRSIPGLDSLSINPPYGIITRAVEDEYSSVRLAALDTIFALSYRLKQFFEEAQPLMVDMFNDEQSTVRFRAIWLLYLCGRKYNVNLTTSQLENVMTVLQDDDPQVRNATYKLLSVVTIIDDPNEAPRNSLEQTTLSPLTKFVNLLVGNINSYSSDTQSVFECLSGIGRIHAYKITRYDVNVLLKLDPQFLAQEQKINNPVHIACLILLLNARIVNPYILKIVPKYVIARFNLIQFQFPDLTVGYQGETNSKEILSTSEGKTDDGRKRKLEEDDDETKNERVDLKEILDQIFPLDILEYSISELLTKKDYKQTQSIMTDAIDKLQLVLESLSNSEASFGQSGDATIVKSTQKIISCKSFLDCTIYYLILSRWTLDMLRELQNYTQEPILNIDEIIVTNVILSSCKKIFHLSRVAKLIFYPIKNSYSAHPWTQTFSSFSDIVDIVQLLLFKQLDANVFKNVNDILSNILIKLDLDNIKDGKSTSIEAYTDNAAETSSVLCDHHKWIPLIQEIVHKIVISSPIFKLDRAVDNVVEIVVKKLTTAQEVSLSEKISEHNAAKTSFEANSDNLPNTKVSNKRFGLDTDHYYKTVKEFVDVGDNYSMTVVNQKGIGSILGKIKGVNDSKDENDETLQEGHTSKKAAEIYAIGFKPIKDIVADYAFAVEDGAAGNLTESAKDEFGNKNTIPFSASASSYRQVETPIADFLFLDVSFPLAVDIEFKIDAGLLRNNSKSQYDTDFECNNLADMAIRTLLSRLRVAVEVGNRSPQLFPTERKCYTWCVSNPPSTESKNKNLDQINDFKLGETLKIRMRTTVPLIVNSGDDIRLGDMLGLRTSVAFLDSCIKEPIISAHSGESERDYHRSWCEDGVTVSADNEAVFGARTIETALRVGSPHATSCIWVIAA